MYIYDGDDTDSDELVHGYHSGIIYTSSNQVLVIFSADAEQHDQRFKIAFTRISGRLYGIGPIFCINPLTAGHEYISGFHFAK